MVQPADEVTVPLPLGRPISDSTVEVAVSDVLVDGSGTEWKVLQTQDDTAIWIYDPKTDSYSTVTAKDFPTFTKREELFEVGHSYTNNFDVDPITYKVVEIEDGMALLTWFFQDRKWASWADVANRSDFVEV